MSPGAKVYKGKSSEDLAIKAGYMNEPLPEDIQKEFKVKTLQEAINSPMVYDANEMYAIFQRAAERYLKKKGYQGAFWSSEDEISPKQYQIWDKSIVKKK